MQPFSKKLLLSSLFLTIVLFPVLAEQSRDSGPLYGKTFHIPFSIYLQGPDSRAKPSEKGILSYSIRTFYLNDNKVVRSDSEIMAVRDFESFIGEIALEYTPVTNLKLYSIFRVQAIYGGFMDQIIEGFHSLFNFPNGGRELIPQNDVSINIQNENGIELKLDENATAFCDTEIWGQYTFLSLYWLDLAGAFGFKIPTGALSGISVISSGYVDLNLTVMADFYVANLFSFYVQAGITIPMDSIIPESATSPYPFFTGKLAVEFHPWDIFSLIVQMNIKSPSIEGGVPHWLYTDAAILDLPQTNLLVGFTFHHRNFRWQFYVEEDIITNQGNDILFNISFTQEIPLLKP